ncbi:MAG: zinc ABC transporter substrate-binding protein [Phycisphaerales bacterium]|nr:zinc ABC transporter substrate-binding protein [Phycisphaerales bacterium]
MLHHFRLRAANRPIAMLCLGTSLMLGCESKQPEKPSAPVKKIPTVYTTFYPTTYFAKRIGGNRIEVVCPCPEDADPAQWMPDEKTIKAYQQADLIVINGASFEKWVEKVTLPESRLVNTAKPLQKEFIILHDIVTHAHGPEGEHSHEGVDGHTWLDPINAKIQATEIMNALIRICGDDKETFQRGFAELAKDLDALDARYRKVSKTMKGRHLMSSHPAYNYLARRYGWRQEYYHLDPEVMPDEQTLRRMRESARAHSTRFMLWEAQPAAMVADKIGELGLRHLLFLPCEVMGADEIESGRDYLSMMNENLDRLEKALTKE